MDTSSPFFVPPSPVELEQRRGKVSLSQLLEHVRAVDQRGVFLKDVHYNSPAPSIAPSCRSSKAATRRSKRSGLIIVTTDISIWPDDTEELKSAATASSIASVAGRRASSGKAVRQDSLKSIGSPSRRKKSTASLECGRSVRQDSVQSSGSCSHRKKSTAHPDYGRLVRQDSVQSSGSCSHRKKSTAHPDYGRPVRQDSLQSTGSRSRRKKSDCISLRKKSLQSNASGGGGKPPSFSKYEGPTKRTSSLRSCWWDDETDSEEDEGPPIHVMARRSSRAVLTPSKRSIVENINLFDPSFCFSRRCVNSPDENIDPLDNWFAGSL